MANAATKTAAKSKATGSKKTPIRSSELVEILDEFFHLSLKLEGRCSNGIDLRGLTSWQFDIISRFEGMGRFTRILKRIKEALPDEKPERTAVASTAQPEPTFTNDDLLGLLFSNGTKQLLRHVLKNAEKLLWSNGICDARGIGILAAHLRDIAKYADIACDEEMFIMGLAGDATDPTLCELLQEYPDHWEINWDDILSEYLVRQD